MKVRARGVQNGGVGLGLFLMPSVERYVGKEGVGIDFPEGINGTLNVGVMNPF